jgi:hypothetical protein
MATRVVFSRRASALYEQREEPRHRIECVRASASVDDEAPFVATLEDISTFGCKLSGVDAIAVDARLWLRLPGSAPAIATIAWSRGGEVGCRFVTPISQGLMRSLLPGTA